MNYNECIAKYTHYVLEDGRFWDIENARFVSSISEGDVAVPCFDKNNKCTVEGLIDCLDFYGYPKGELRTDEELAKEARERRNALIAETDFMAMPDYPLNDERKAAVLAYRQALRDVPEQAGFPRQIDWPTKP